MRLERDLAPIARVTDTVLSVSDPRLIRHQDHRGLRYGRAHHTREVQRRRRGGRTRNHSSMPFLKRREPEGRPRSRIATSSRRRRDLAQNRIQLVLSSVAIMTALAKSGKSAFLAIAARQRSPLFKDNSVGGRSRLSRPWWWKPRPVSTAQRQCRSNCARASAQT